MKHLSYCILVLLFACSCSKREDLPAGYSVFSENSESNVLVDKSGVVVIYPNVVQVKRHGNYVSGFRRKERAIGIPPQTPHPIGGVYGAFWLDANTGDLEQGLSDSDVLQRINSLKK